MGIFTAFFELLTSSFTGDLFLVSSCFFEMVLLLDEGDLVLSFATLELTFLTGVASLDFLTCLDDGGFSSSFLFEDLL